ncbi:S8 family peptidase [Flavobacterium poyangense]|uniref:S8 family peptidase n=1 Tax=Flavobacterium poyangense TaxID=2204302 RepID=UPI00142366A1|nr:S8 family serine peptidase [Flavobacterium sp. JXAS1]
MARYKVIVHKLNVRKTIPADFTDKTTVFPTISEGHVLDLEEVTNVPNPSLGRWYKDAVNQFYWGGGLQLISEIDNKEIQTTSIDKKDWGFLDFKIDELWKFSRGENIKVAILDSGLNYKLDDFKNKTNISYYNACTDIESQEACFDTSGHGTDCAGILCAQGYDLWGVAPNITLDIIKIIDSNDEQSSDAILLGLERAIKLSVDVISLSFYIPNDDIIREKTHSKIKEAYNKGITIVSSAGNSGSKPKPANNFPASFPECLSIGGIDKNRIRSKASTKSDFLDLMGPGEDIFSLTQANNSIKGTSYSAPFVAGVIALLKSIAKSNNKPLSNIDLFDILKRSADTNILNYNKVEYGWGILNPYSALNLLTDILKK